MSGMEPSSAETASRGVFTFPLLSSSRFCSAAGYERTALPQVPAIPRLGSHSTRSRSKQQPQYRCKPVQRESSLTSYHSLPRAQSLSLHVIIMLALPSCVASPSMLTQLRTAYSSLARITALDE